MSTSQTIVRPPGPRKNLTLMDRIRFGFFPPAQVLQEYVNQYGNTFRVVAAEGTTTFTADPALIREVYTANPDVFEQRGVDITTPVFGSTSLPVSSGARHKRDRKLLSPPFQSGTMRNYGRVIAEIAREWLETLRSGQTFSMLDGTQSMALDVILRVVYGVSEGPEMQQSRQTILDLIHALNPIVLVFPALRRDFGGRGPWAKLLRAGDALESLVGSQIRAKRIANENGEDIMSLLLRAKDEDGYSLSNLEIAQQLRAILFAGHETTAISLAMVLDMLHRHPDLLEQARNEVDSLGQNCEPAELANLPFLGAACHEALRMYPPVVDVGRVCRESLTLGHYRFDIGEAIVPSPLLLHNRADLYPEPHRFRPERFLNKKPSPFEFIAFGGGNRRCLGAAFALYEMKIIVGTLLQHARFAALSSNTQAHVRRGITLGPRGNVPTKYLGKRMTRS